jgi:hypothetical protein
MDPYRSLCESDAKMLVTLEMEDMIARADAQLVSLRQDLRRAVTPKERAEIIAAQREMSECKALLVRQLATDSFYIPRALRWKRPG